MVNVGDPAALRAAGCGAESIHAVPHGSFKVRRCDLPKAVASVPGAIWATKNDSESLVRIDPSTNRVTASIAVGIDAWYLTAIDFRKGTTTYKKLAGTGLGFNNNYAPVSIGPNGNAYVGALGGLVLLRDR